MLLHNYGKAVLQLAGAAVSDPFSAAKKKRTVSQLTFLRLVLSKIRLNPRFFERGSLGSAALGGLKSGEMSAPQWFSGCDDATVKGNLVVVHSKRSNYCVVGFW